MNSFTEAFRQDNRPRNLLQGPARLMLSHRRLCIPAKTLVTIATTTDTTRVARSKRQPNASSLRHQGRGAGPCLGPQSWVPTNLILAHLLLVRRVRTTLASLVTPRALYPVLTALFHQRRRFRCARCVWIHGQRTLLEPLRRLKILIFLSEPGRVIGLSTRRVLPCQTYRGFSAVNIVLGWRVVHEIVIGIRWDLLLTRMYAGPLCGQFISIIQFIVGAILVCDVRRACVLPLTTTTLSPKTSN